jgi:hypothetical protein
MADEQSDNAKPVRTISRRTFLPWLIAGVTGVNFLVIRFFIPKARPLPNPKYNVRKPRFVKPHKIVLHKVDLKTGFYLNNESKIIHYLADGKSPQFMKKIGPTPVDPTKARVNSSNPRASKPRVSISRASYSFEHAAAAEIKQKNIDRACDLLIYAVEYELQSAYRAARVDRFRPSKQSPSFRLYDLLAGLSVRFNKPDYMKRMIDAINSVKDSKVRQSFDSRIKKWQDSQSGWYSYWSDQNTPVKWTVMGELVLPM